MESRNDPLGGGDGRDNKDFGGPDWLMSVLAVGGDDGNELSEGETTVELLGDAGELKGDTSGDSGRGIEVGDSADGAVVGSKEGSASPMIMDGKDAGECSASGWGGSTDKSSAKGCDSILFVNDWPVSSPRMPASSLTDTQGGWLESTCFDDGFVCISSDEDWDMPDIPSFLLSCRLTVFMLECNFPGPHPAGFKHDSCLRSVWLSDFARRAGDQSGVKTTGVSGNVWYPADTLDDDTLDPGLTVRS